MSRALKFVFIWHRSEANALSASGRTAQSKLKFIRARFEPNQSHVPAHCRDMTCDAFPPRRGRPPVPKTRLTPSPISGTIPVLIVHSRNGLALAPWMPGRSNVRRCISIVTEQSGSKRSAL